MNLIKFPIELAIFSNRIENKWLIKLKENMGLNQEIEHIPTLNDYYTSLKTIYEQESHIPSELWSMGFKLAWLFGDVGFYANHFQLSQTIENDPIFLFYFGAGLAEFIDLNKGLELIKNGIKLAESSDNGYMILIDFIIPYILILNNSDNKELLKEFYLKIKTIFKNKLNSEAKYQYLILLLTFFIEHDKGFKDKFTSDEILKIAQNSQNPLAIALFHNFLAKWDEKASYSKHMEASIQELRKINAKFRLVIAYTNIASFYASKADYKSSSKYFDQAFSIIEEFSKNNKNSYGTSLYTLIQNGIILVDQGKLEEAQKAYQLALENAVNYNSVHYQLKSHINLATVSFLLMKYKIAFIHILNVKNLVDRIINTDTRYFYLLKCSDLLIDLNKLNEVEKTFSVININDIKGCLKAYYMYVKGKFELNRHNLGIARDHFTNVEEMIDQCPNLKPSLLFTLSEAYIQEYRLSEDSSTLQKAQKMIEEGLEGLKDVPTRMKGQFLLAFLLAAQERHEEAEEVLETILSSSIEMIPHFRDVAEKLLENIRDTRLSRASISPITNFKDVIRYLRDAKTTIESQPR